MPQPLIAQCACRLLSWRPTILLCVLAVSLPAVLAPASAQNAAGTERRLQQSREQLRQTTEQRRQAEAQAQAAARELRAVDQKVAAAGRALAEAEAALAAANDQLATTQAEASTLQQRVRGHREQLARLLRNSHAQGNHSALKLLLSQDHLSDTQRVLAYSRYLQRQQMTLLAGINADLERVQQLQAQANTQQAELVARRDEQHRLAAALASERRQQAAQVARITTSQQQLQGREQSLQRDVRALESVLANLRAQAQRAQAARAQAQRQTARREPVTPARPGTTRQGTATAPRAPAASTGPQVTAGAWPLSGRVVRRYGVPLGDGRRSTGVLIEAAAGTPVTAVADGKVVYSDWMTGYGMILIVDHGNGYMSLYAHNESLLRDMGSRVRRGESVARVGNSGGQGRNALYFEVRRNGQPVDPASWLRR